MNGAAACAPRKISAHCGLGLAVNGQKGTQVTRLRRQGVRMPLGCRRLVHMNVASGKCDWYRESPGGDSTRGGPAGSPIHSPLKNPCSPDDLRHPLAVLANGWRWQEDRGHGYVWPQPGYGRGRFIQRRLASFCQPVPPSPMLTLLTLRGLQT